MNFSSDNCGPAAPEVMEAVVRANDGYALPYGADPFNGPAVEKVREVLEAPEASVHFVTTGSAANVLALSLFARPYQAIFCHELAHIELDECGAPEFYTGGAKLRLVDGAHGRMTPEALRHAIAGAARGDVHSVQPGPVSITQITEVGTAYSLDEIRALTAIARDEGLPVHMDGARFANAVAALGCTPAEMTWKSGVDALSFGGTKNGCLGVEAVVVFDPSLAWELELRRKRGGHLWSKHRYLAAQFEAYLADDLWLRLARASNERMAQLYEGVRGLGFAEVEHVPDGNMLWFRMPRAAHARAFAGGAVYKGMAPGTRIDEGPDDEMIEARVVCDWARRPEDVDRLIALWRG